MRFKLEFEIYKTKLIQCFQKFKGDVRKTWKEISDTLNKTEKKRTFPNSFYYGEEVITEKLEVYNKFNLLFSSIGPKLAKNIT